ncbi:MAG: hypothetical protein GAK28_00601 [Luteibacter sp.]|uniref:hypothetical protein n=1 Tax=Luteibacter sp. TaxID=1886636 RepID=UPI0013842657|nr:hypothetical protein [Luteibacter sp.]KAF1008969.1 MAG: hypothetical protein GAK28_00601 [Luteibacter sp.]
MRHHAALWQSRADGEYRRCARCEKLGYGEDAWHPATPEFFPVVNGRIRFGRCRACHSEVMQHRCGVVSQEATPARGNVVNLFKSPLCHVFTIPHHIERLAVAHG